jgi:hypothetical protein
MKDKAIKDRFESLEFALKQEIISRSKLKTELHKTNKELHDLQNAVIDLHKSLEILSTAAPIKPNH